MKHLIRSTEDLGLVIRAVRKSTHVRQDDLAGAARVSRQFTVDVEKGKPTVQFDRVMRLLDELGIPLSVDIPEAASLALASLLQSRIERSESRSQNQPLQEKQEEADT